MTENTYTVSLFFQNVAGIATIVCHSKQEIDAQRVRAVIKRSAVERMAVATKEQNIRDILREVTKTVRDECGVETVLVLSDDVMIASMIQKPE